MSLTPQEKQFVKNIKKERNLELKTYGEYAGYAIPSNHPDNELTPAQKALFTQEKQIAEGLVKKKVLKISSQCRRVTGYDLREEV